MLCIVELVWLEESIGYLDSRGIHWKSFRVVPKDQGQLRAYPRETRQGGKRDGTEALTAGWPFTLLNLVPGTQWAPQTERDEN